MSIVIKYEMIAFIFAINFKTYGMKIIILKMSNRCNHHFGIKCRYEFLANFITDLV